MALNPDGGRFANGTTHGRGRGDDVIKWHMPRRAGRTAGGAISSQSSVESASLKPFSLKILS